jgi:predicted metal-binding protein
MADFEKIRALALSCGFTHIGDLNADTIELRTEVRAACEDNKCNAYGTNWACPPACGTLDECTSRIRSFSKGLILQTTGTLEDAFDVETMMETAEKHKDYTAEFAEKIAADYPDAMVLGAGACTICKNCTYPANNCRFPDKMISSLEAYGMVVSDLCTSNDIPYYYGPNTITYVGCILVE